MYKLLYGIATTEYHEAVLMGAWVFEDEEYRDFTSSFFFPLFFREVLSTGLIHHASCRCASISRADVDVSNNTVEGNPAFVPGDH